MQGFNCNLPKDWTAKLQISRIKMQMAININTVHLLHPKKEENGCLYCIKIHAIGWHSLVIKTREGEPAGGGGERVEQRGQWGA